MFSRSNHHHPRQRSSSPPQVAGQIRPRSPDSTNSESSEDAAAQLQTKSPHTDRVVKRGRLHDPDAPAATQAAHPSDAPLDHPAPANPQVEPHSPTPPLPTASDGVAADHLKHLETLLDSVLATIVIIQSVSTSSTVSVSPHAQEALKFLHTLVPMVYSLPTASTSATPRSEPVQEVPTRKLYAQATQTARSPPAGQLARVHSNTKGTSSHPSHQPRHSPYRLIARWPGHPIPSSSIALDSFVRCLDCDISGTAFRGTNFQSRIASANITKSGNLVIHTTAPFTATQLREYATYINRRSNMIPGFDPPPPCSPILELDVPWHGIVVHDLPAASLLAAFKGDRGEDGEALGIWEALEKEAGIHQEHIRDVRMLCRDEDQGNQDHLSLRVMLEDSSFCDHLCRNGVSLIGTHCRVSRYRPRRRPTKATSKPTSPH